MQEIEALNIFQWDSQLDEWLALTQKPRGAVLTKKQVLCLSNFLTETIGVECEKLKWHQVNAKLFSFALLFDAKDLPTFESVNITLSELKLTIHDELIDRKFVMIEGNKSNFFEQEHLFGKHVRKAFPSAQTEIRSAGNCLAMDENTAAVFHLMRVAELGMRALAHHLKVKLGKNTIDSAGWTEIIKNIKAATDVRWGKRPQGKKSRQKATDFLKFCEVATDELNIFKEIWRNSTMHAGLPYDEHEAHGVFVRVRDFMQRLATKVSETNN